MSARIVIIGAGHAGAVAAGLLRQSGHAGPVVVLGDEVLPPYQRPPLSKGLLKGETHAEGLALRPAAFYRENNIELRLGARVEKLDPEDRQVFLQNGQTIPYAKAILATGARPIHLSVPGANLSGVLTLRTAEDADTLKAAIRPGRRVAIVGGGYIGLEVAASVSALGGTAVVLERAPRLLARSASEPVADFFRRYHEARGVALRFNAEVVALQGHDGHVTGVQLACGAVEPCDVLLVGIGVTPNVELAKAAGLRCDRGVTVDQYGRTSEPDIYAIGDCTCRPSIYGRMVCPESVASAIEQARQVAAHITGHAPPALEVPWNWSDQYDLKLQVAGFPFDVDQTVVRGNPAEAGFAVFHLANRRVRQVEAINAPAEFMGGRQLILQHAQIDVAKLADRNIPMRAVANTAVAA
jgi:3-phenylpropionate/trans-cinnamate dioxygenase ferredoxin reductase subunit